MKRTLLTFMFVSLGSGTALADDRHRHHYANGFQAFINVGHGHHGYAHH
ncbi:MAG: hypothetical protein HKO07_00530, partial [Pseudomonadales bacterium]|nr:hypothetical protein [Pseudomonadales bacterium]